MDSNEDAATRWSSGTFTDTGQNLSNMAQAKGLAVGDVDGDGDLDITYATKGANTVWTNDGTGTFTDLGQTLGLADSKGVALGDVDGDGDLDITYANNGDPNTAWANS